MTIRETSDELLWQLLQQLPGNEWLATHDRTNVMQVREVLALFRERDDLRTRLAAAERERDEMRNERDVWKDRADGRLARIDELETLTEARERVVEAAKRWSDGYLSIIEDAPSELRLNLNGAVQALRTAERAKAGGG